VTDYQLWEGRAAGADLALLIVAALSQAQLTGFLALGDQLGLTCLVETHTTEEVRRALDAGARLVGVNNRNLKTLDVDLSHFEEMAETIGDAAVKVAESGILSVEDAVRMRTAGADAVLVGELLVRHGDPRAAVAALRAVA
jgi:indole-3-glycerol phosphate synthase